MKVIQSYIPYQEPYTFTLDRDYVYIMMLSSLLAKEHYDSVTLYTNNIQKQFFVDMGFVYEYDTDVLNEVDMELWVLPKLLSCLSQNEPFIHIDLDTLLLDKLNIDAYKSPYIFAHPDISDEDIIRDGTIKSTFQDWNLWVFFKVYLEYYYTFHLNIEQIENPIPTELCSIPQLPNMSVILIKENFHQFKKALLATLDLYNFKRYEFDSNRNSAMFLEQMCLPLYLKQETENIDFGFLNTTKEIRSQTIETVNSNRFQFYHLGGANRNNPNLISMVIDKIINDFGIEYITKIFDYYKKRVRETGNLITLTDGEKSYEKNNTTNIFTKRIKGLI